MVEGLGGPLAGLPAWCQAGALKMREWKMQEWKMREQIAGVENAGVENAGAIMRRNPSEEIP